MRLSDVNDVAILETFTIRNKSYNRISRNEVLRIFENFDFRDETRKEQSIKFLKKTKSLTGWLVGDYLLFRLYDKFYHQWHFLNLEYLDIDDVLNQGIESLSLLNDIFNIIYQESERNKETRQLIPAPDLRRLKLYEKIIKKVLKKYKLPYKCEVVEQGFVLEPILMKGSLFNLNEMALILDDM